MGSAGSTSASRQTYVTGAAVKQACEHVRERVFELAREEFGGEGAHRGRRRRPGGEVVVSLVELLDGEEIEETVEFHHKETEPLDEKGQGNAHLQFVFAAHRAVVEVDTELGLVRVVEVATAQDVGKIMNPQALEGQIEGGIAQGLGLALLEEIQIKEGKIQNASFTDYLIPTILDMPSVRMEILELADPEAPYGLKGVGEPPTIASTPAIVAALRDATGRELRASRAARSRSRARPGSRQKSRRSRAAPDTPRSAASTRGRRPSARLREGGAHRGAQGHHVVGGREPAARTGRGREGGGRRLGPRARGGPETTVLAGGRQEVLEAVTKVMEAALDAGAHAVRVRVEAEGDAPRFDDG